MTNKEILHKIILGLDPYLSCGVPKIYWTLTRKLTLEVYGRKGLALLESHKHIHDGSVSTEELLLWSIETITPKELISQLEQS